MSAFDDLPTLNIPRERVPDGFQVRQRSSEPSAERDEMDAKVDAAGGTRKEWPQSPNEQVAAGRMMPRPRPPLWVYFIPTKAFDR